MTTIPARILVVCQIFSSPHEEIRYHEFHQLCCILFVPGCHTCGGHACVSPSACSTASYQLNVVFQPFWAPTSIDEFNLVQFKEPFCYCQKYQEVRGGGAALDLNLLAETVALAC